MRVRVTSASRALVTKMHFATINKKSMKWWIAFSLILFVETIKGGLISQSSIQSCDWGDSNEPTTKDGGGCKEKFVVSMTLKSGQVTL